MKNQMIIGDDPKFRQICAQGICSLEIRRPGNFDGGVYSCKAINDHGEATVSCKLEVKRKCVKRPKAKVGPFFQITKSEFSRLECSSLSLCVTEPAVAEAEKK